MGLGPGTGDEKGCGRAVAERLDDGRLLGLRPALDDPVVAALGAQCEAAFARHPDADRQRQTAIQERAGDVAQLGRRQVPRKRCGKRIIKVLGRRAGRVHTSQSSGLPSYTLALL